MTVTLRIGTMSTAVVTTRTAFFKKSLRQDEKPLVIKIIILV
jgi:hypothetical protein